MGEPRSRSSVALATVLLAALLGGCWSYVSDEAQRRFAARTGPIGVTVYPVHVMRGGATVHDAALAQELAAFLGREGLADAVVAAGPIEYPFEGGANQARMAQRSARAFAAKVREADIATDYALMVEVLANPDESVVIGVHYYLVERGGEVADGSLTNSHWEEFEKVKPHDRRGGLSSRARSLKSCQCTTPFPQSCRSVFAPMLGKMTNVRLITYLPDRQRIKMAFARRHESTGPIMRKGHKDKIATFGIERPEEK